MQVSQPLIALDRQENSSKSSLLVAGFTMRFMRRRAGFSV